MSRVTQGYLAKYWSTISHIRTLNIYNNELTKYFLKFCFLCDEILRKLLNFVKFN